jgi:hypothetical protein
LGSRTFKEAAQTVIWTVGVCTLAVIVIVFRKMWDSFDGAAVNATDDANRFWDVRLKRGIDGKRHVTSVPLAVKVGVCLLPALFMGVICAVFLKWFWGF